jgi:putative nucleotidyltransferase with HDIG domain
VVPLFVAAVFGRRTAMVVVVVLSLVVSSLLQFDLVVLSVLLSRGMIAVLCYWDRKHPRQMVSSGLVAGLCAAALYLAIVVSLEGRFDPLAELLTPAESQLLACGGGGLAAGVLGILLRLPAERLLGNVPRERLLELQDLAQPLLEKLAAEAPGTFEHSRWMANLAEQAASAIGADALLTRVGAYYHDLGKTAQPKYFVENLERGERSPHEDLEPDVSADAIMAHVVVGTRILRDRGIPEPVVEFAYTHHGTQLVSLFWTRCQKQGNPKKLNESDFRYPGMKPHTKETAIVMLVDSIEAASRTIDPPNREQFELMVQSIAFAKLRSGELDDCGLSLSELRVIANRVTDTLVNMNHQRLKYPWQAEQAEEFGVPVRAVLPSSPEPESGLTEESRAELVSPADSTGSALPLVRSKPPPVVVDEEEAPASSDTDPPPDPGSSSAPARAGVARASDQRDV